MLNAQVRDQLYEAVQELEGTLAVTDTARELPSHAEDRRGNGSVHGFRQALILNTMRKQGYNACSHVPSPCLREIAWPPYPQSDCIHGRPADQAAMSGSDEDDEEEDEDGSHEELAEEVGAEMPSRASLAMMADAEAIAQVTQTI